MHFSGPAFLQDLAASARILAPPSFLCVLSGSGGPRWISRWTSVDFAVDLCGLRGGPLWTSVDFAVNFSGLRWTSRWTLVDFGRLCGLSAVSAVLSRSARASLGIEPATFRTLSENQTTAPSRHQLPLSASACCLAALSPPRAFLSQRLCLACGFAEVGDCGGVCALPALRLRFCETSSASLLRFARFCQPNWWLALQMSGNLCTMAPSQAPHRLLGHSEDVVPFQMLIAAPLCLFRPW